MPIGKKEVLEVLEDARLGQIRFSYGRIHVNAAGYQKVADHIAAGTIKVVRGTKTDRSEYSSRSNTLKFDPGFSVPLDGNARSSVVHECTHAMIDLNKWSVLMLENEAVAFIAKFAYLLLLNPSAQDALLRGTPQGDMQIVAMQLVKQYQLGGAAGLDAEIRNSDIEKLARMVERIPAYFKHTGEMTRGLGVPDSRKFHWLQAQRLLARAGNDLIARVEGFRSPRPLVADQDLERQPCQGVGEGAVRRPVGDQVRDPFEIADADRGMPVELAAVGNDGGGAHGAQHQAVQLRLLAGVVHHPTVR